MLISNRYSVIIVLRWGVVHRVDFYSHSGWVTGGCDLHMLHLIYCFHRFGVFCHCLRHLLTDIRMQCDLGGYFSGFSSMREDVAALLLQIR